MSPAHQHDHPPGGRKSARKASVDAALRITRKPTSAGVVAKGRSDFDPRIDKKAMMEALHREHEFSNLFLTYLLARNIRYEEDLVDQLFNSSEKRLARILLLLANFGKEGRPETVVPKITQEMLAEMIGTTRSRVSFFMNRFRKLGFIHYNGGLQVHSSLLSVVLHD
jgi:CRP/FNR family transcriptional regulator, cyclic AMP receptor protein